MGAAFCYFIIAVVAVRKLFFIKAAGPFVGGAVVVSAVLKSVGVGSAGSADAGGTIVDASVVVGDSSSASPASPH